VPRESLEIKLEPVNCFVSAKVEKGGIGMHLPLFGWDLPRAIVVGPIVANNIDVCELAHFVVVLVGPHASDHEVSNSFRLKANQVLHDGGILHRRTTLLQQYLVVVWYLEEFPDLVFGHGGDVSELILPVT